MITLDRKALSQELALLVQIAGQKNVIPSLSTIRFEVQNGSASLLAYNSHAALFTDIPAEGEDWKGCIPARQLYDLMRLAANVENVTLTPQGSMIQIAWGRSRHRLPITNFSEFPEVQSLTAESGSVTVKTEDFSAGLGRVLPCAAREDSNNWMVQGIKLEASEGQLKLIGTNTHRLGVATIPAQGKIDLFIPLSTALLLPRFESEEVVIHHDGNQAAFFFGNRILFARLMTGMFPNWQAFMPKDLPSTAAVSTSEMLSALKRADVTRDETFKAGVGRLLLGVVFIFSKEEMVIDTKHSTHGRSEESVPVTSNLDGDLIYMGINPDYVMDFLKTAGETTECNLKDGKSPLRLTDGTNFEYVVVPQSLR